MLLIRCRRGRRQRLSQGQPHGDNLLLLLDDDLLRDTSQLFVVTVAQFGLSHVDGALVVRNHHCNEVLIDVA